MNNARSAKPKLTSCQSANDDYWASLGFEIWREGAGPDFPRARTADCIGFHSTKSSSSMGSVRWDSLLDKKDRRFRQRLANIDGL